MEGQVKIIQEHKMSTIAAQETLALRLKEFLPQILAEAHMSEILDLQQDRLRCIEISLQIVPMVLVQEVVGLHTTTDHLTRAVAAAHPGVHPILHLQVEAAAILVEVLEVQVSPLVAAGLQDLVTLDQDLQDLQEVLLDHLANRSIEIKSGFLKVL